MSECDSYTDYHDYRIERAVILGFSTHTRNLFSEMRKYAANFEGTAYLAENDKEYEHRENYSMGGGMYLERGHQADKRCLERLERSVFCTNFIYNGERCAGWIYSRKQKVRETLAMYANA